MIKKYISQVILGRGCGTTNFSKFYSKLLQRIGATFVIRLLGVVILFGLHILLSRLMGAENYGVYILVYTWLYVVSILSMVGFGNLAIRYVAAYSANEEWALLRGIYSCARKVTLLVSLVMAIVLLGTFTKIITVNLSPFFMVVLFYALPVISGTKILDSCLRGFKLVVQSQFLTVVLRPCVFGLLFLVYYFSQGSKNVTACTAMVLNTMAFAIVLFFANYLLTKKIKQLDSGNDRIYRCREWLLTALPLLITDGSYMIFGYADILMVGTILGPTETGHYAAATKIASFVVFSLSIINIVVSPLISELFFTNQHKRLRTVLSLAALGSFLMGVICFIPLVVFGKQILSLFGETFIVAFYPLVILLLGQFARMAAGAAEYVMVMTEHQKQAGIIVAFCVLLNIALNIFLIPRWGLVGAATATAMSTLLWNMLMAGYVYLKLDIDTTVVGALPFFYRTKYKL